ncbi:hypothetical protein D9756_010120 [Leucocoprinus leucothites]|uniref:Major facilitator superfamily (MFS) profile domain-containing protein n=1 Tax=Leucocoprinus leucothites TaxID=201217 RepID=A0A8H5CU17_9AGAR|nr:hypothetical protein D9756_010120 [Leucoagaricus leucothites]
MNSTMERANAEDEEPGHDVQRVWGPDDELNVERPESVKGDSKSVYHWVGCYVLSIRYGEYSSTTRPGTSRCPNSRLVFLLFPDVWLHGYIGQYMSLRRDESGSGSGRHLKMTSVYVTPFGHSLFGVLVRSVGRHFSAPPLPSSQFVSLGEMSNGTSASEEDSKLGEKSSQETSNAGSETAQGCEKGFRTDPQDDFPDGGLRAWIVVIGVRNVLKLRGVRFCQLMGVFQAYYQQDLLRAESPSTISWIGSIQYSLVFFPGLIVGRLFDLGYFRVLFITSGLFLVVATFLAAQCTEYWQLLLSQGIMAGLGCGGLFTCSNSIIAHWFKKKRGRALGYMAVGSALSGTTIPIIVKNLLPVVGFRWTMRTLAFIFLLAVTVCNLTMKPRLPPVNVKGGLFNFAVFKHLPYTLYCLSIFISFLGMYTVMTFISTSAAQTESIPPGLAFYFVTFVNASSLLGRWSAGVLADIIGPLNVMAPATVIVGVATYAWPFARSTASLVIISIFYGFAIGSFVSLLPKPAMNFGAEGDVGRRVGMFLTIAAFAVLAGPPISGAIERRTGRFEDMAFYAGSAVMLGLSAHV